MNRIPQENTTAAALPIAAYNSKELFWTMAFIVSSVIVPALLAHTPQNQWITGTIVNAILFLAIRRIGILNAALVATLPSSIALLRGLLPPLMTIAIPWIIISNYILILVFFITKKYPLTGILFAATSKFFFLYLVATFFLKIGGPFLMMLQWPQLITALAGGLLALGIQKIPFKSRIDLHI